MELLYILQAFANDLQYMKLHCVGELIDIVKATLSTLEDEVRDELVDISDIAMMGGIEVDNINNVKSHLDFESQWSVLNKPILDTYEVFSELKERGTRLISAINNAELPESYKSMYLKFWNSQILVQNEKRLMNPKSIKIGNYTIDISRAN